MDIKILLLICYNALSISESYYAAPESLEQSGVPQLQNGNRRLYSEINNEDPDQSYCFPKHLVSSSLEEKLDPQNNGLHRLVVYLYLNVLSDQASLYIPNRDKQALFASLNFEQGDVLQNLTDKEILKNNTNISILINNTSPQPLINDTSNITHIKWSTDMNSSINETSPKKLKEPSTNSKNLQSSDLLNSYNSKQKPELHTITEKPNLFQTPNPNSRSNLNKNRWENARSDDSADHPTKSPLDYNDGEYKILPFLPTHINHEKERRPTPIGFNQVPYMISHVPEPELNLSQIVTHKNNIVHFTRNYQSRNPVLQPYRMISPHNSGNEVSGNMIGVPVKFNLIKVPQSHNTISLHKGLILPQNLISALPNHPKVSGSPINMKAEPYTIGVHSKNHIINVHSYHPNLAGSSVNLGIDDNNMTVFHPNHLNLEGRSDNLRDDLNKIQVPPNHPNLVGRSLSLGIDNDNMIAVPPNYPNLEGRSDNLRDDLNKNQVPPNRPNLAGRSINLGIDDDDMIIVPPNHVNLEGRSDNLSDDLNKIQVLLNPPNLAGKSVNLGIDDDNIIVAPPKHLNLEGKSDNLRDDFNKIQLPPNRPNLTGISANLGIDDDSVIVVPPNHRNLIGRPDNLRDDLNKVQVPPSHPNLPERSVNLGIDDDNMIVGPPDHPNFGVVPDNFRINPNMIRVAPNHHHPNFRIEPNMKRIPPLRVNSRLVQVSPNHHRLNFRVKPHMIRTPPLRVNPNMIRVPSNHHHLNFKVEPYMIGTPPNQPQLLRINNLFSDWFYKQIGNQGLDVQINIDALKRDVINTLARYNMYISEDGYLIDSQGNILSWDYLQLRTVLVEDPMECETIMNPPGRIHFEQSNAYWKALLTTVGPSSQMTILDIIPLGKMQLLKKSGNVPIDRCICKSEHCKPGIIPVHTGDPALLAKLQNYMQLQRQQLNVEQLLNRRNVGLKLDRRKEPLHIYDKYRPHKAQESSKKEALTKSGRREKDPVDIKDMKAMPPRTMHNVVDWRIIGGAAATSSGAPISVRGRSGYIF